MTQAPAVTAQVVYESFFGNTARIAEAVSDGLRFEGVATTCVDVADVRELGTPDLLVVGAPTHAFALSRPSTRDAAVARRGSRRYAASGMREWLTAMPRRTDRALVATFDTRVNKTRHLPASASRSAGHLLRRRGFEVIARPAGFIVQDTEGPLDPREVERAVAWGRTLAHLAEDRVAARQTKGWAGRYRHSA